MTACSFILTPLLSNAITQNQPSRTIDPTLNSIPHFIP